jgi:hypothetical protein
VLASREQRYRILIVHQQSTFGVAQGNGPSVIILTFQLLVTESTRSAAISATSSNLRNNL